MAEKLKIMSLGGLNEIGKNMTVLEYGQKSAQKPRHPFIPVIGPVSPSPDARLFPRRAIFIKTYSLY